MPYLENVRNVNLDRLAIKRQVSKYALLNRCSQIKQGIWLYFWLLIFEGAIRKWLFPSLATPLLIIREPVALWLVLSCWQIGLLRSNSYIYGLMLIGFIGIYTAFFLGHGNFLVAFYGARIMFLNIPLIFVIGKIFNRNDVLKMGITVLWLVIPMTLLIALQFYSPQSAWVNRGVGGDIDGAGFGGALGYFRPPGTFSFTNGTSLFYSLAASFVFYFWLHIKDVNRVVLILATIGLLASIPLSISRSLFFQVCISLIFSIYTTLHKPKQIGKIIFALVCAFVMTLVLSKATFFTTSVDAFTSRFENANEMEGGMKGVLGDRFLGGMLNAFTNSSNEPFFGYGIGMGTNVGYTLLGSKVVALNLDQEWARIIGELGPILGLGLIFFRLGLSIELAISSYKRLSHGDLLPWMLLSFGFLSITQAQWAQPTSLGFFTLIAGLLVASLRQCITKTGSSKIGRKKSYENNFSR